MKLRRTRYALITLMALACRGAQDSSAADSSVAVPGARGMTRATPGATPRDSASAPAPGNPSLDPTDTVPVRRAPPATQSIIDTASLTTIQKIIAGHPQHVDSTITAMGEELKRANRTASAEWTALQDSCKKDLDTLASLSNGQLVTFFRQHYTRFTRLGQVHRAGMGRPPST